MKTRDKQLYMDIASRVALMSYANRLKVGAVLVKNRNIISFGYNGTPMGWDNTCEDKHYFNPEIEDLHEDEIESLYPFSDEHGRFLLMTKPIVIHAEENAIIKAAKDGRSVSGASLFITHAPCINCAKLVLNAGIIEVFYDSTYRSLEGIKFLMDGGVYVEQVL